jgi:transposase
MTERFLITDSIWEKIAPLLPAKPGDCGRKSDNRLFVEAVLFIARTGTPWRDIPKCFGHWNSIYKRFGRWERQGVWLRVFSRLAEGGDLTEVSIDGTSVRAHQHAAGAEKKTVAKQLAGLVEEIQRKSTP